MPRSSDLIGLPVLSATGLKRIGRVQELLLSSDGSRVCGLILEVGSWLHPRRVLDFRAIRAVGESHILADESFLPEGSESRCRQELHGLPVLHATGQEAGVLADFQFELETGRLTALQLSHGLMDDLLSGKENLPLCGPLITGEAAIIIGGAGDFSGGAVQ